MLNLIQDLNIKTDSQIQLEAHLPWNIRGKPPLHEWLLQSQDEEEHLLDRLKAAGNIVIPRQAQLALHLLADGDIHSLAARSNV